MGSPRLTLAEIERRDRYNRRYSALFQRIKKLFSNRELKTIRWEYLKTQTFSNYLIANITRRLIDNKNTDPFVGPNEEFKRKIIEEVQTVDDVQVVEVVNVEDDTGPFPKTEQEDVKIEPTLQVTEEMQHCEIFEQSPEEIVETELMIRED
jgi:hypothetical protein